MKKPLQIGAAALAMFAGLVLLFGPSPYDRVKNRDARGTAIVAFGDSLTAGAGAREADNYPSRLAILLNKPIVNAGVNGDTTESALQRLDDDVLAESPRLVIVGLGGNDFLRRVPIATTEANLRTIVRRIQAGGAMVILLGFEFPNIGPSYADMYERVADDEGCLLIEDVLDGVLNNPKLKSDEIHPNAAGYALMADRVAGPTGKLLEE
jgi:acyl-CoA thioesterase-1